MSVSIKGNTASHMYKYYTCAIIACSLLILKSKLKNESSCLWQKKQQTFISSPGPSHSIAF